MWSIRPKGTFPNSRALCRRKNKTIPHSRDFLGEKLNNCNLRRAQRKSGIAHSTSFLRFWIEPGLSDPPAEAPATQEAPSCISRFARRLAATHLLVNTYLWQVSVHNEWIACMFGTAPTTLSNENSMQSNLTTAQRFATNLRQTN